MIRSTEIQTKLNRVLRSWPWFPLQISQRKVLLIGVDLTLLNAALLLGLYLNLDLPFSYTTLALHPLWFVTLTLLWLTTALINDNYLVKQAAHLPSSIIGIIKTLLITGVIYTFVSLVSPMLFAERSSILLVGAIAAVLLTLWRIAYAMVLVQPNFQRRALIVGTGPAGRTIAKAIEEHNPGYEIIGYLSDDLPGQEQSSRVVSAYVKWANLTKYIKQNGVSDIILAIRGDMHPDLLRAVLKCFELGVRILPMPELYEEITGRIPVEHISERWLVTLPIDWDSRRLYLIVKRVMDIVIAGFGLMTLAPFFALVVLAIKLDSRGPVFYRPERLGRGGKPFRLWKFRTMVPNADRIGDPTFTAVNDQRITRVGRILRVIHMDELPQFINVLTGEMSVVGPRPERYVPELEESIPYYRTRLAVKPGATGWGLVNQGYAEGLEGTLIKLQYDLYYIKHQSLYLDILIIFKTVIHMFTMRGR